MNNIPRILFFTDDPRVPTGVGVMTKAILDNTQGKFEWHVLGGMAKHFDPNKIIDYNSYTKLYTIPEGYGNQSQIAQLVSATKPDAILFFTDPKVFVNHYRMEYELRQSIPFMYYTIWDNYPLPLYNYGFYKATDGIFAITKQTKHIAEETLKKIDGDIDKNKVISHVPHGIDIDLFKRIDEIPKPFQNKFLPKGKTKSDYDFIVLFNNKNMGRKRPVDLILAFNEFVLSLTPEQRNRCLLILHTNPVDVRGNDLVRVVFDLVDNSTNIHFSINGNLDRDDVPFLYNMAHVTVCNSDAEGHGLSVTESIMCEVPVIATVTGGLQEQLGFSTTYNEPFQSIHQTKIMGVNNKFIAGEWAYPLFPDSSNIIGSVSTPYCYEDRVSINNLVNELKRAYINRDEYRQRGKKGRRWLIQNGYTQENMVNQMTKNIYRTINLFKPRPKMEIINI